MKKVILMILCCAFMGQAFAQTIIPTGIGMGTRRTNATSNVNILIDPLKLNPGIFTLPNQIILVNDIVFNFNYVPPVSYPNSFTNQITHKLF